MNYSNDYNQFLKQQQMEMYYHHQFLEQLRNQGLQIDNPQYYLNASSKLF